MEDITVSASDGQVKVGKLLHAMYYYDFLHTEQRQAYDRSTLLENEGSDASGFGIMLEDLVSRVPNPLILQQSNDLLTFIRHTGQMTYQELRKV